MHVDVKKVLADDERSPKLDPIPVSAKGLQTQHGVTFDVQGAPRLQIVRRMTFWTFPNRSYAGVNH
ncbi:hypothetical protein NKI94_32100 [Mesorhizobium australicum]|uniref:hypothetical protein n=1 Tax=Mesorhizobium australicum TaxID=536018 RepID=UPI003336C25E